MRLVPLGKRMKRCLWAVVCTHPFLPSSVTHQHAGEDRKTLIIKHSDLTKELEGLRLELSAYSEQDPVEIEKKYREAAQYRSDTEKWTDKIMSMEGWLKEQTGGDKEAMSALMRMCYGDDFDEEEGGLREV